jgi:hypothetical protein
MLDLCVLDDLVRPIDIDSEAGLQAAGSRSFSAPATPLRTGSEFANSDPSLAYQLVRVLPPTPNFGRSHIARLALEVAP